MPLAQDIPAKRLWIRLSGRLWDLMDKSAGDLQDGMLSYYLEQSKFADTNVESRVDKEPFDYRLMQTKIAKNTAKKASPSTTSTANQ